MKQRPDALGIDFGIQTIDDVDNALHEMSWLTSLQESIEAPAKAKIEALKNDSKAKLKIEIDGQPLTIQQRWEALKNAVLTWCVPHLKQHLANGKKSLKLSHGELKTRKNEAAVKIAEGQTEAEVALEIARCGGLLESLDTLLDQKLVLEGQESGIPFRNLIAIHFVLAKDPIKQEWARRPEHRELLQSLSISVEEQEQFTVCPARAQVATTEE